MVITEKHTGVLIVGAGPSGLMMAAQLLRYGVQPVIIDSKQGPTNQSKALAVQARSLEIYRQLGIVERAIAEGKQAKGVTLYLNGEKATELLLNNVGSGQTPFPFVHLYQQNKNERLLLEYLTQNCCPVYWNTSLLSLQQNDLQTEVQLKSDDQQYAITCDWIIGADGAHSTVRKQFQIPFKGDTYQHNFYLADLKLDNKEFNEDFVQLFLDRKGFAGFFPMPETQSYRIVGSLPDKFDQKNDLRVEDILPYLNNITNTSIKVIENHWFTIYHLHHRMADKFGMQRCYLIGDSAHIHSPVGGQGMNTGLQDAYNLAWKLAMVVNKQLKPSILDSYEIERMPVAKTLLSTTDRVFTIIMSGNWLVNIFKTWILPKLLSTMWNSARLKALFFKRLSQIGISYRNSPINLHLSHGSKVKAGDRLPYLQVYDEKKQTETDLHEWCSKPGFTLIILGKFDELYLFTIAKWITQRYPGVLNFFYLPPSGKNLEVFNAFEVMPAKQKALIVRPDMHIGYMNDVVDISMMDNYLRNVVGFK